MLNQNIFYAINSLAGRSAFLDSIIVFFASIFPIALIIFVIVYFFIFKKSPLKFFLIFGMVLIPASVTIFLQWVVFRHPRPFMALPDVHQLISISGFTSFPSEHATIFSALAMSVFFYNKKMGIYFFIFALLIGIARVASGVHFPADILAGFAIGFIFTYFSYRLFRKMSIAIKNLFS